MADDLVMVQISFFQFVDGSLELRSESLREE